MWSGVTEGSGRKDRQRRGETRVGQTTSVREKYSTLCIKDRRRHSVGEGDVKHLTCVDTLSDGSSSLPCKDKYKILTRSRGPHGNSEGLGGLYPDRTYRCDIYSNRR